jgi:hypothetical protein
MAMKGLPPHHPRLTGPLDGVTQAARHRTAASPGSLPGGGGRSRGAGRGRFSYALLALQFGPYPDPAMPRTVAERVRFALDGALWLEMAGKADLTERMGWFVNRAQVVACASRAVPTARDLINAPVRTMAARLHNALSPKWIEEELRAEVDAICATFERGMRASDETDETTPDEPAPRGVGVDAESVPAGRRQPQQEEAEAS